MPTALYGVSLSGGGVTIQKSLSRQADHANAYEIELPAGYAAELSTRVGSSEGVVLFDEFESVDLTDGDIVDVYWDGGVRYGMEVDRYSAEASILGGSGDALPLEDTALVVSKQVAINTTIDGDAIKILGMVVEYQSQTSTDKAHIAFYDDEEDEIAARDLMANIPQIFDIVGGAANPFAGDPITHAAASNGSASDDATLKIISIEDSTP